MRIAKIVVAAAVYAIDKPYLIKTTLACLACVVIIFQFQNLTYLFGSRHLVQSFI